MGQVKPGAPIRWGIVGTGVMARAFAQGLASLPDAQLAAISSRSGDRARKFAQETGAARSFGSHEELLAAGQVDLVYIATPNPSHAPLMLAALDARQAILCEKPFAMTANEARAVASRAAENGLFCMEAMWMRFLPGIARVKKLVDSGAIGTPLALTAQIGYPYRHDAASRLLDLGQGGGALLDLGVYALSLGIHLLGPIATISGEAIICETRADTVDAVVCRHVGGGLTTFVSAVAAATSNEAFVLGSGGTIRVHEPYFRPDRLTVRKVAPIVPGAGGTRKLARLGPAGAIIQKLKPALKALSGGGGQTINTPYQGNGYQYQAAEAMRCLRSGQTESPTMPLAQTIAVLEATDSLRRAWGIRYPGESSESWAGPKS